MYGRRHSDGGLDPVSLERCRARLNWAALLTLCWSIVGDPWTVYVGRLDVWGVACPGPDGALRECPPLGAPPTFYLPIALLIAQQGIGRLARLYQWTTTPRPAPIGYVNLFRLAHTLSRAVPV